MDGEIPRITIPVWYATPTATIVIPRCNAMRTATTASRPLDTRVSTTDSGRQPTTTTGTIRRPITTAVTTRDTAAATARRPTTTTITIRDTAAARTMPLTTTMGHTLGPTEVHPGD